ncbi:MAG: VOC family protein [Phycisphaeraceae bacterium]
MITRLAHLCFIVRDLDAMERFYVDLLGLTEVFTFLDGAGKRRGMYLHAGGGTFIEMFKGEPTTIEGKPAYQHFCLQVDDLDTVVSHLRQAGVTVTDPKRGHDRSHQAWITDPEGNRIELHHYTSESGQRPWVQ